MKMKKILSSVLALTMVASMSITAFATEVTTTTQTQTNPGQETSVPVEVTVEGTQFSVTVPTSLPAHIAADGTVTVANNCSIINGAAAAIKVSGVTVNVAEGWTIGDFEDDFSIKNLNSKVFGLQIADTNVQTDGTFDASVFNKIGGNETRDFTYVLKMAPQTNGLDGEEIATVVFTISWFNPADDATTIEPTDPEEP